MQHDGKNFDRVVVVREDVLFDPHSDFNLNTLYLLDSQTRSIFREPLYAF